MSDANPIADPELAHYVTIAGKESPGVAKVTNVKRAAKWDEKEGPGTQGAFLTFRGTQLVDFSVKIRVWEESQYDDWNVFSDFLTPIRDKGTAVDFWHPAVDGMNIRSVVILSIGAMEPLKDGDSLHEATIELREYRAVPKTNATNSPGGSAQGPGGNGKPVALTAAEQEAQALLGEASKIG